MTFRKNYLGEGGISIVEIVVSIFIFSLIISVFSASLSSFDVNKHDKHEAWAYSFARAELEALRSHPFSALTTRTNGDFIGLAYNFGKQRIASDGGAVSAPQIFEVGAGTPLSNNVSSIVLLPQGYYSDFIFSAYVKVLPSSGTGWRAGIIFRYQDVENYYYFCFTASDIKLVKVQNGAETILYANSGTFSTDSWYNLKVVTLANNIQVYLGGSKINETTDSNFTSGYLGFMGVNSVFYNLDNVHLESAIQNKDWSFDAEVVGSFPQDFLQITPVGLPGFTSQLTIEDYAGSDIKKITARVNWLDHGAAKKAELITLRSKAY